MKQIPNIFSTPAIGVLALLFTAPVMAVASPVGAYGDASPYSAQIAFNDAASHTLSDYKRMDSTSGNDALFGSASIQDKQVLVFNTLEISLMNSGEVVPDKTVNGKPCPTDTAFQVFVSPVASCSVRYGRNYSGIRAYAQSTGVGDEWKPLMQMNVGGQWRNLEAADDSAAGGAGECRKVLVQKICQ